MCSVYQTVNLFYETHVELNECLDSYTFIVALLPTPPNGCAIYSHLYTESSIFSNGASDD